ncbi:MAG: hypothetical protein WBD09_07455 [Halobacteriota archaeon]
MTKRERVNRVTESIIGAAIKEMIVPTLRVLCVLRGKKVQLKKKNANTYGCFVHGIRNRSGSGRARATFTGKSN